MIEIIAGTEAELAALKNLQETGLPEAFYEHGYMIRIRRDGRLQTVGGGERAVTVHHVGSVVVHHVRGTAGAAGTGLGGVGGTTGGGGSTFGNAAIIASGGGGSGSPPSGWLKDPGPP